ncbi:hypothetical protein C8046_09320 [Serinibacter arcticus]|uniref:Uncharacterized protein n=1 Tax=Serinibacter arcticus TaxID=1655435 RepID=A0A2U1ZUZ4_9MICO|nr:hypothetical protein [Serinibacter arcticus]PWD50817.1 hypothetical protein C8046_09320 [Serinibacter arcticus]
MTETQLSRSPSRRVRLVAVASLAVLVAWGAAAAWLSVPRGGVCLAVWPAPPGCSPGRPPLAVGWFVGQAVLSVGVVALAHRSGSRAVAVGGVLGLALIGAVGYWLLTRA